jgi:hypothetical protein
MSATMRGATAMDTISNSGSVPKRENTTIREVNNELWTSCLVLGFVLFMIVSNNADFL